MSAALSLFIFWGIVLAIVLLTRRPFPAFLPDKDFTNTYKGIAMFLILYHHSRIYHGSQFWFLFGGGDAYIGVSMFFFISGFGLVRSQEKKALGGARFLTDRMFAIVPGVILCMLFRGAIAPLWGQPASLETDPLTLLGLREWFLVALFSYYLVFILCWKTGDSAFGRNVFVLSSCLLLAVGLANIQSWSTMVPLWLRFPFSFALGVILSDRMEQFLDFCQRNSAAVLILSGMTLALAFSGRIIPQVSTPWIADIAIIPLSIALCSFLYKLHLTSNALLFIGRYSLFIYLVQVPILKYGLFINAWRTDVIGLLVSWASIIMLSAGIGWMHNRLLAPWIQKLRTRPGNAARLPS